MFKRLFAVVLSLILAFSFVIGAYAAPNYDDWGFEDGACYAYYGDDKKVTVPNEDVDGIPTTTVDPQLFKDDDSITHLTFENGIQVLSGACCNGMKELVSVELPATLENFGYGHNFIHCDKLKSITVPGNTAEIPRGFVFDCDSLTDITISYGVQVVSWYSIGGTKLKRVVFPETVNEIHGFAMNELKSSECEVVICNPDCELGKGYSEEKVALDNDPLENNPNVKFTIIVPENSKVSKYYSSMDKLPGKDSVLIEKPAKYFASLEENQEDYGLQYKLPVYQSQIDDNDEKDENPDQTTDTDTDTNTDSDNNDGQTVVVEEEEGTSSISKTIIIVVISVIVAAIIAVAIVLAVIMIKNKKGEKS